MRDGLTGPVTLPRVGLSLMPEDDFRAAAFPLFAEGSVDALEWSFDLGWGSAALPDFVGELLDHYAAAGALYGHGVHFSLLSGTFTARQAEWLARLSAECGRRRYRHVSEHFGFMTAGTFDRGAPLPVPLTAGALRIGHDRLGRLSRAAGGAPIGLENLAFAFGSADVRDQGRFLEDLLAPTGGFVVLDLHNLYCQALNFGLPPEELLARYPLGRVRELHLSGGSWSYPRADPAARPFRRDTHDGEVPAPLLPLLRRALASCPAIECVILERLGGTLSTAGDVARFRDDFRAIRALVTEASHG